MHTWYIKVRYGYEWFTAGEDGIINVTALPHRPLQSGWGIEYTTCMGCGTTIWVNGNGNWHTRS